MSICTYFIAKQVLNWVVVSFLTSMARTVVHPDSLRVLQSRELSFKSMGVFRWEFVSYDFPRWFVLHTTSIFSYHLWCRFGGW